MKLTASPSSSLRFVCGMSVLLTLAGCQTPSDRQLEQRITQIQNQRCSHLQQELTRDAVENRSDKPEWTHLSSSRAAGFVDPTVFSLAASQPEADSIDASGQPATTDTNLVRGPLPGFAETLKRDLKRWPTELLRDTASVYTDPANIVILLGASGATIALRQHADEDNAEFFEDENHFGQEWRDALSLVGSPATHFVLGGLWYAVGVVKQDEKTYEVGRTLIDALVINGLSTLAIKFVSSRDSPNGEEFAFPSAHASSTVTFAAVMHEAYGPWVGIPLYGLSALVAIERLDDREHWLSDVVFGAAMGWVVGHTVAGGRRPEIFGGEIAPYVSPDTGVSGLAWVKTFD